jgi:outer membrane protein TolC
MSERCGASVLQAKRIRRGVAVAACCLTLTGRPARSAESIDLGEIVRATLANNADLRLAALNLESARAAWLAAAAPFDSALVLSGTRGRSFQFTSPPATLAPPLLVDQTEVTAAATKRFRNGIALSPGVSTTQMRIHSSPRADYTRTSVQLKVAAPLLRDFGGTVTRAPEDVARVEYVAAGFDEQQVAAQALLRAAQAYWDYLAATRRLDVESASEERARRTAEEMGVLVRADERTRSDLAQAQGTLASRRATRIAAEQKVVEAWADIAVLMGAPPSQVMPLPRPSTGFPATPSPVDDQALRAWTTRALGERPDVAAAQARLGGAQITLRARRNELWPRLDLAAVAGFSAQEIGPGLGRISESFYRDVPGVECLVQLTLELPLVRSEARGRLAQASAAYQQDQILHDDLRRRIGIEVIRAIEVIRRSGLALEESQKAVTLLEQTEESEKRKFKLGVSTLLAVIQAEDSLTSARLTMIEGQLALAVAIANLRFETGALAVGAPGSPRVDVVAALLKLN